ncbi:hypothetical protein G5V58_02650 [Nocardioides anomalus]|uniref:Uncharacterized protein n=1 Tax=Nocardioides anomalus TaxID=2712223 RepID=A0A6G6W9J5_9ACTN|nr:hypothetical protein [Nocardioides anomalus]QIG41823.1 hypothetical protein G5V58_02650 [Nocardioides anomalus]
MRRLLALATALLGPLALVLVQPDAHAQGYPSLAKVTDRAGDAPAGVDLLSGRYQLSVGSARRATFQVRVKKLTDTTFLAFEVHPEAEGWDRIAVYRENGRTVAKMYFIDTGEEYPVPTPVPRACPDLSVTWAPGRGEVTVTAPWRCFQAASSAYAPFEFQAYSRVGGQPGGAKDSLPAKDLDF